MLKELAPSVPLGSSEICQNPVLLPEDFALVGTSTFPFGGLSALSLILHPEILIQFTYPCIVNYNTT